VRRLVGAWRQRLAKRRDEIAALVQAHFAANPDPNRSAQDLRRENLVVRVGADMDMPGLSHETRVLERRDGRRVIACMATSL
jgi:hypothetical protein